MDLPILVLHPGKCRLVCQSNLLACQ